MFGIGLYERWVTLGCQQNRAVNLAAALDALGRLANKRVLVVGAGLAGLTFAVAARRLDADVTVVDRRAFDPETLGAVPGTAAVHVSPGFHCFPEDGWKQATTASPVLRWDAGPPRDFVEKLLSQACEELDGHLHWTHPLDREAIWDPAIRINGNLTEFDYVVLAVGRTQYDGTASYWSDDQDRFDGHIENDINLWIRGQGDTAVWDAVQWLCGGEANYREIAECVSEAQSGQIAAALGRHSVMLRSERNVAVDGLGTRCTQPCGPGTADCALSCELRGYVRKRLAKRPDRTVTFIPRNRAQGVAYSDAANSLNLYVLRHITAERGGAITLNSDKLLPSGVTPLDRASQANCADCRAHKPRGSDCACPQPNFNPIECAHGLEGECAHPVCNISGGIALPEEAKAVTADRAIQGLTRTPGWSSFQQARLMGRSDHDPISQSEMTLFAPLLPSNYNEIGFPPSGYSSSEPAP